MTLRKKTLANYCARSIGKTVEVSIIIINRRKELKGNFKIHINTHKTLG
jgi:hypothetical protein